MLKVDRFGNLITNITPQDAPMLFTENPRAFKIVVGTREITEIKYAYAWARREKSSASSAAWDTWRSPPTAAPRRKSSVWAMAPT